MLLLILFLIIVVGIILYIVHDHLAFPRGHLARPFNKLVIEPITRMGPDQFIELSYGTVHYIHHGSSSSSLPLNIFVHGYSTPMEMWQHVYPAIVKDNQPCLVFDLYGRGWSDSPDVPMNIDIFVSQLAELLYALDLPYEKYNLFGVSMGGAIVQRFAEVYPKRVASLILCCSAGLQITGPSKLVLFLLSVPILGPMVFKAKMTKINEQVERLHWARPDDEDYKRYRELYKLGWEQHPGYLRSLHSTITNFNFESSLKTIEVINKLNLPVLIIWGDKDTLIPVESAYRYHQLYKSSSLTIIPGATHMMLLEDSKPIIDSIKEFLSARELA